MSAKKPLEPPSPKDRLVTRPEGAAFSADSGSRPFTSVKLSEVFLVLPGAVLPCSFCRAFAFGFSRSSIALPMATRSELGGMVHVLAAHAHRLAGLVARLAGIRDRFRQIYPNRFSALAVSAAGLLPFLRLLVVQLPNPRCDHCTLRKCPLHAIGRAYATPRSGIVAGTKCVFQIPTEKNAGYRFLVADERPWIDSLFWNSSPCTVTSSE